MILYKEEGYQRVQNCGELAQIVLANTAPAGHEAINNDLQVLQDEWNTLASKMVETKVSSSTVFVFEILVNFFPNLDIVFAENIR